jgi:hypothetical protein
VIVAKVLPLTLEGLAVAGLDPNLSRFITILLPGSQGPQLQEAIQIVKGADGLIVDEGEADRIIHDMMLWACMTAEAERRRLSFRRTAREINAKRSSHLHRMKTLRRELENDRHAFGASIDYHRVGEPFGVNEEYSQAVHDLDKAIGSIEAFIETQNAILIDRGGNSRVFEIAFVHAVRACWSRLTGRDAGVSRNAVVKFAEEIWIGFNFTASGNRALFDWLSERFENTR